VREGRQAESGIGDSHPLRFVGQNFSGDVDEQATLRIDHLSRTLSTMYQDEMVNALSCIAFFQSISTFDDATTMVSKNRRCQLWG
jgi:hypothetical protein